MYAELRDDGVIVNHKRVGRLMKLEGLVGITRRKKWRTTKRDKKARPAPDLVERDFATERPDQLWVADIAYIPIGSGFLFLSDQGTQYTSIAFGLRCKHAGVRPSMGSVGDAYDNDLCESFFATLECELLDRTRFRNQAEARMAVFDFIEGWYNPHRRHSALGQKSPLNYERSALPAA